MENIELAVEIIDFSTEFHLFSNSENMKSENIAKQLNESWFVEHLIHEFIIKAKYKRNMDFNRLKKLLLALEKVRLDLEYDV